MANKDVGILKGMDFLAIKPTMIIIQAMMPMTGISKVWKNICPPITE